MISQTRLLRRGLARLSTLAALLGLASGTALGSPNAVYVPLGDSNTIARINTAGTAVEAIYSGVENAHGLALTPDGQQLYVASLLEQSASAPPPDAKPAGVTDAEHNAHHAGAAPAASAAPRSVSFVTRLDAATGAVQRRIDVQRFTHHLAVTPDGRTIIGVQPSAGQIAVIDAASSKVQRFVPVGNAPNYALVSRDGARVFVSAAADNQVVVLDGKTWRKVAAIPVGGLPEHMVFSPDEKLLYVVNVGSNELSLVDTATLKEVRRVPTGEEPHGVAFNAASRTVVVANKGSDTLSLYDPDGSLAQTVPLGPQPYHLADGPGGQEIWVSSRAEGTLWRVSAQDFSTAGSLQIPGIGHQVAVAP